MGVNYDAQSQHRHSATLSDYDYIQSLSADSCLYCLTEQQATFILGLLYSARSTKRWFSAGTIDNDWLDAFFSELRTRLMTDACDISTQLTSLTNLINDLKYQITVLDNNMCVSQAMALNFYRAGVVTAGQAAFPDTTFSSDSSMTDQTALYAGANGLCQTIYRYITSVLADQLTRDSLTVGLIAGGAGVLNPILGVIASGIGAVALADFAVAVNDQSAIDDTACCMYKALRDAEVTFDKFKTCLDDCGFSFPDNNATVAGAVGLSLDDEANYLSFVSVLKSETDKASAGAPTSYPVCGSCGCGDVVDFTAGQRGDWEIIMGTQDANGIGSVDNTDNGFGSHHSSIRMTRKFPAGCDIYLLKVTVTENGDEGRSTTGANHYYYVAKHVGADPCITDFTSPAASPYVEDKNGYSHHESTFNLETTNITCLDLYELLNVWKYWIEKIEVIPY